MRGPEALGDDRAVAAVRQYPPLGIKGRDGRLAEFSLAITFKAFAAPGPRRRR